MPRGIYKRNKKSSKAKAAGKVRKTKQPSQVEVEVHQRQALMEWINRASTREERAKRKVAMMGIMYGGSADSIFHSLDRLNTDHQATTQAGSTPDSKSGFEGTSSHRWNSGGPNLGNIPKEAFNPDSPFAKAPIHHDPVNHPAHYLRHPSGVEHITITEHFNFNRGNAIKYIWRADEKGGVLENLRKARWYVDREISRLEKEAGEK